MLSSQAREDRFWSGLTALRSVLSPRMARRGHRGPLTSIDETERETMGRLLDLAELILEYRADLLTAATLSASGSAPESSHPKEAEEVSAIARYLKGFASRLKDVSEDLDRLTADLCQAHAKNRADPR